MKTATYQVSQFIYIERGNSDWKGNKGDVENALNQKLKLHSTCPTHVKCSLAMKSFKDAHAGGLPSTPP